MTGERISFFMVSQSLGGQGVLIIQASRSLSLSPTHTHHSVGLHWPSDQPDAETST